jgi:hypothetical protein
MYDPIRFTRTAFLASILDLLPKLLHGLISPVYSCLDPSYFPTYKYLTDLQDTDTTDESP